MGAVKAEENGKSIEINYGGEDCPFIGLDTSAPPQYINNGGLAQGSKNALILNKALTFVDFAKWPGFTIGLNDIFIGVGDLNGILFYITFDTSGTNNLSIHYDTTPSGTNPTWSAAIVLNLPLMQYSSSSLIGLLTYKNINNITYFSFPGCPYILQWDGTTLGVLTNWLGCAYLNEINGRLVAGKVYQIAQALPNNTYTPSPTNTTTTATGTSSTTSPVMLFPSNVIGAGAALTLIVNYNASITLNPATGGNNGSVYVEYSIDGGITWNLVAENTNVRTNWSSGNLQRTISLPSGILNSNQVELRTRASTSTFSGSSSATSAISSASLQIVNAPVTPVLNIYPYQLAWSAGLEQFGIWNVLDTAGHVTGAGFENLPDVEDYISGIFMDGPTGFILRSQGITEITPLSSGINPFDFNHFWASHQGIGNIYPNTASQYGSLGYFISNDDVYTLGYSGLGQIGGLAKSSIFSSLANLPSNTVYGSAGVLNIDGEASPIYALWINQQLIGGGGNLFLYWQNTQMWYQFDLPTHYEPVQICSVNSIIGSQRSQLYNGLLVVCFNTTDSNYYILVLPRTSGIYDGTYNVYLKAEELLIYRDITIDAIIANYFFAEGTSQDLTISFFINTFLIGTMNVLGNTLNNFDYAVITGDVFTGKSPQLQIQISGGNATNPVSVKFGKITLFGSMDTTQRPI